MNFIKKTFLIFLKNIFQQNLVTSRVFSDYGKHCSLKIRFNLKNDVFQI